MAIAASFARTSRSSNSSVPKISPDSFSPIRRIPVILRCSLRGTINEALNERVDDFADIEQRTHLLAQRHEGLMASAGFAEHESLNPVLDGPAQGGEEEREDESERRDDPDRGGAFQIERAFQHPREHDEDRRYGSTDGAIDRALLDHRADVEHAVADDRGAEHQGIDHVGRNPDRIYALDDGERPGQRESPDIDNAAENCYRRADQDEDRAIAAKARIRSLVGMAKVNESCDEKRIEVDKEDVIERARRWGPPPCR